MIGKLEEGRGVTSVAEDFGINKNVFEALGKPSKRQVQLLGRLVMATPGNCSG